MQRKSVLITLVFASTVIATPAAAKTPAERYAACLAQTRPAQVRQLLQAPTPASANQSFASLANDNRCLARAFGDQQFRPEDIAASADVLRGRLAEQVLLADQAKVAALQGLPLQKAYNRPWFAGTGRNVAVDEMGACVADTDPAGISGLIKTEPGSAGEQAAMAALSPALGKCLTAGARLDASRAALRAALADALYHRVNEASGG